MSVLLLFTLGSFFLTYLTSILLARTLGADGYDDYAVAVAAITIFATLAEMGTGKLSIRLIPSYVENRQWSRTRGYGRFSLVLIFSVSLLITIAVIGAEKLEDGVFGDYALGVVILFLPATALVGASAEWVMANQAAYRGAFVTRLLVPGATLLMVVAWVFSPYEMSAPRGALCYGVGWLVGAVVVFLFIRQTTPREVLSATPHYEPRRWLVQTLPFLVFALLITLLAKIGVMVLEIVAPDEAAVAVYAVALETGAFIYLFAKSTDKLFLPDVSLMIERRDKAGLQRMMRQRWSIVGGICAVFLLAIFLFGKKILALFGPDFIAGYPALCIIAVATSFWTVLSLAPSYLKYVDKNTFVIVATGLTVVVHIALCFPLGQRFGATGAALSYAIPVIGLYATLAFVTNRHIQRSL